MDYWVIQDLYVPEVPKVLGACEYCDGVRRNLKIVSPLLECTLDGWQFLS
jgi:hypothetical protein